MLRNYIFILLLLISSAISAQQKKAKKEIEKKGIVYNKELSFGGYIATNGWGLMLEKGKILSIKKTRLWYFSFGELRNMRLRKQNTELGFLNSQLESQKNFFYGKRNSFYALRVGLGNKIVLGNKAEKNGVRVSWSYMAGFSLGILKPYYLNLAYQVPDNDPDNDFYEVRPERYSEANKEKYLDWFSITGASGFKYGLNQIEPVPGGFLKTGLNFDWSKNEEFQIALETGIIADVYYKRIPLMVNNDQNKPYFIGAYINFQFGKRKY